MLDWLEYTMFVAFVRTSLLIVDTSDSNESLAALHSSSATEGLWATHVPKISKKRTRSLGMAVIPIGFHNF